MSKLQNPQINLRGLDLKVIPLIQAKLGGAKSTLNNQHPIIINTKFFFLISNKNSFIERKRHPSIQGVYKGIYTKIKDGKTKKKKNRYKYLSIAC